MDLLFGDQVIYYFAWILFARLVVSKNVLISSDSSDELRATSKNDGAQLSGRLMMGVNACL